MDENDEGYSKAFATRAHVNDEEREIWVQYVDVSGENEHFVDERLRAKVYKAMESGPGCL